MTDGVIHSQTGPAPSGVAFVGFSLMESDQSIDSCVTEDQASLSPRDAREGARLGQIDPKWDKSGTF